MSFEFAKKGLSVLLISRTESKLVEVESELQKKYPKVKIAHVAVDYSNFDEKAQVIKQFEDLLTHLALILVLYLMLVLQVAVFSKLSSSV
jgi:short-subunit dehydrogenase